MEDEISKGKQEMLRRMPYIESRIEKSKDGKFIINKTTITNVRPISYYRAILDSEPQ